MAVTKPRYCRPEAWELFREQVAVLSTGEGLLRAATAIAGHELEGLDVNLVLAEIDAMAAAVLGAATPDSTASLLAHLHAHLFDELKFQGNEDDYHAPENSYLPVVLKTRRGLPITLSLIYKGVAERIGLTVFGINSPAHFLAGVEQENGQVMLVDPFYAGRVLSREDAFLRMEQMARTALPRTDQLLARATHREWIVRILANLKSSFAQRAREHDVRAMLELQALL